jgi:putative membrane protein
VTVNNGEINEAKLAKSRTKNKEVKNFAQQMITDHTAANKKTAALASKMKIKPEESAESKQLKEEGKEELKKLKGLKGDDFDKEYMESQVRDHQKALDTIDNSLLPNAKDAALKDLLTQTRSTVAMHLDNAKKVQAAMK